MNNGFLCDCGKFHFINMEEYIKTLACGKEHIVVCSNCGSINKMGKVNEREFQSVFKKSEKGNTLIDIAEEHPNVGMIEISKGIDIIMLTGNPANGVFEKNMPIDNKTPCPKFMEEEDFAHIRLSVDYKTMETILNDDNKNKALNYVLNK